MYCPYNTTCLQYDNNITYIHSLLDFKKRMPENHFRHPFCILVQAIQCIIRQKINKIIIVQNIQPNASSDKIQHKATDKCS